VAELDGAFLGWLPILVLGDGDNASAPASWYSSRSM
jgi:hypothetical protein